MLSLWAMSYEGDYSPMLMPAFTRATGITVDVQSLPWTAAHEKLLTAFAGGSLPDGAESSQVDALVAQARAAQPDAEGAPAVVVYRATDGAALTPDQLAALGQDDGPVQPSQDGTVAIRLVPFAPGLADEVVGERIDELLGQYAQSWTLDRMPAVDRTALRIGAFELLYSDEVPPAVAVAEAVALVRDLSTDDSPAFVNGVLGSMLRDRDSLTT